MTYLVGFFPTKKSFIITKSAPKRDFDAFEPHVRAQTLLCHLALLLLTLIASNKHIYHSAHQGNRTTAM